MQIRLLGPLEIEHDGRTIDLGSGRVPALLVRLAMSANQVVTADRLIDDLWGETPPDGAAAALQTLVSRLRRALRGAGVPDDVVVTRPSGYVLHVDRQDHDVARFEDLVNEGRRAASAGEWAAASDRLTAALGLWRGEPLEDCAAEAYAQPEIARLTELRLAATEDRIEADLALGRHGAIVGELERLTQAEPLRERLWGQLMLALYRSGRQAEALRAYQALRHELGEELGIDPSPAMQRLEEAILRQDPALTLDGDTGLATVPPPPSTAESAADEAEAQPPLPPFARAEDHAFVGRESELAILRAAWNEARTGARQVAVVSGEPGVGKTHLVWQLAKDAHAGGATVLFGRCDEEALVPYQPFVEAIGRFVRVCSLSLLQGLGRAAADLARVVPDVTDRLGDVPDPAFGDAETERYRLFEAVVALLAHASDARPVVLVVDDVQWADKPTLLLLRHLVRHPADWPVLVVATARDTPAPPPALVDALADMRRSADICRVDVSGLDRGAIGGLVASDDLADRLWRETSGNPFFVRETLRDLDETGFVEFDGARWVAVRPVERVGIPDSVKDVVAQRVARLSEASQTVLTVAAVAGTEFSLPVVESVAELSADDGLDAVEEACASGLVREVGGAPERFVFAHALVREALYDELGVARRARLHGQVADALEVAGAGDNEPGALAYHYAEGAGIGNRDKAIAYALRAARMAMTSLAPEEAISYVERGLGVLERGGVDDPTRRADLLLALAEARAEAGDRAGNQTAALAAAEVARRTGAADRLAHAAITYAGFDFSEADTTVGRLAREALDALGDDDPALRARLLARLAGYHAWNETRGPAALPMAAEAVALARRAGDVAALRRALGVEAAIMIPVADQRTRIDKLNEVIDLARADGDRRAEYAALFSLARATLRLGDRAGAEDTRRRAEALLAGLAWAPAVYDQLLWQGSLALLEGRYDEVNTIAEETARHEPADPQGMTQAYPAQMFIRNRDRGRADRLVPQFEAVLQEFPAVPIYRSCKALLLAELGRVDEAADDLERLGAPHFKGLRDDAGVPATFAFSTEACARLDRLDCVDGLHELLEPYGGQLLMITDGLAPIGAADRFLGMLAAMTGDTDQAAARYEAAIELEERLGAVALAARTRSWYARLRRGHPEGKQLAGEARAVARRLRMTVLERECEAIADR